jgi:2'-5' RNA ligase
VRLFVAVWPDDAVLDQLAGLDRPVLDGVRWTTRDQWHITLRFFGEVAESEVPAVSDVLRTARARSVQASLGPRVQRVGSMLWAPVEGLAEIAAAVVKATASVGAPPEDRRFRGHITLARQRSRGRGAQLRSAAGQPLAGSWEVRAVDLVRSHLGSGGSRYERLSSVPLN